MKQELEQIIADAVQEAFEISTTVELSRPEEQFGDYATNVALKLTKDVGKSPRAVAEQLVVKIREKLGVQVKDVTLAGPGFINLKLSNQKLIDGLNIRPQKSLTGKVVVAEYSDPNPFKVLHAGHLYTSVVGDAIANLLENAGATVHRVNFGGDVGLHVAKTMWAILEELGGEDPQKLNQVAESERAEWLTQAYVKGNAAYDDIAEAKPIIIELNKKIYQIHNDGDKQSSLAQIYWTTRQWSYEYFDQFYARIGSKFEKYYPESQTAPVGLKTVQEHVGEVYTKSDGAVVFDGEKYGLHTRVFINSEGLPTYEAKDVGLIMLKWQDYKFDLSVIITGNDIIEYMKVVLKSIEQFEPELPARSRHLTHGIVKLQGGTKMSSRLGNILKAEEVLEAANQAAKALGGQDHETTVLGAVKYAFLKNRAGGDIIYDPKESVSLEGNSGPYLQYAHARAKSILNKVDTEGHISGDLEADERSLVRKITEYPEVVDKAAADLMPHFVATYLYELAQVFNSFYERNRVVGDQRQTLRLGLVQKYANTLKNGLSLLGIAAPDKM